MKLSFFLNALERELRLSNNVVPLMSKEEPIFPRREGLHDCPVSRSAQEKEVATINALRRNQLQI